METVYLLDEKDLAKLVFETRYISGRQINTQDNLQWVMEDLRPFGRLDMYWVDITLDGQSLDPVCIDPSLDNPEDFTVAKNWCKASPFPEIATKVSAWFKERPEYQQQIKWVTNLRDFMASKFGSVEAYREECYRLSRKHHEHKVSVARRFHKYFLNPDKHAELSQILEHHDVYRKISGMYSGFDHMKYIWERFVKDKKEAL